MKVLNEMGEEIEVYTAEELEAQKQTFIEEYKGSDEFKELQTKLTQAEEELGKFKDKDLNFGNLRVQKEAAEKKIEEILGQMDSKIEVAKKEVLEGVMQDYYNDTMKTLSDGDEELKKKIEHHYKRLGDPASTKEAISEKLRDAYLLATKPEGEDALNSSVISSGGVAPLKIKSQEKSFSADEKALLQKLGNAGGMTITDEDIKKYA